MTTARQTAACYRGNRYVPQQAFTKILASFGNDQAGLNYEEREYKLSVQEQMEGIANKLISGYPGKDEF